MASFRCSDDEKAAFYAFARSRGVSFSEFVRDAIAAQISAAQPPVTASVGASSTSLDAKG